MTVLDEKNSRERKKYDVLQFVEFLEFICRVALTTFKYQETVETKVYNLLRMMFETKYATGKWNPEDHPLY